MDWKNVTAVLGLARDLGKIDALAVWTTALEEGIRRFAGKSFEIPYQMCLIEIAPVSGNTNPWLLGALQAIHDGPKTGKTGIHLWRKTRSRLVDGV